MTDADDLAESVQRLYEQARDEGRREAESQASEPEPKTSEQVLADRLAAARSHWVSFDIGGSR